MANKFAGEQKQNLTLNKIFYTIHFLEVKFVRYKRSKLNI